MNATQTSINCSQTVDKGVRIMNIFVTGGSGYVGQPIVKSLLAQGHRVSLLTRRTTHVETFGDQIDIIVGDLFDDASLKLGLNDADAVIHLVGIIREDTARHITMASVHVEGTQRVVDASIKAGVRRLIHMSALGARSDAASAYHQSKWEAEKKVRQSGLDFTIFRPSIVFGPGGPGPNFCLQLADAARQLPFIPMIGDGSFQLQPVHTHTIADLFTKVLNMPETIGETFDVSGLTVVSYRRVIEQIVEVLQIHKPTIHIPLWLIENTVRLLGRMKSLPLSMDQLIMLKEGNVCANTDRVYEVFQLKPKPFVVERKDVTHHESASKVRTS